MSHSKESTLVQVVDVENLEPETEHRLAEQMIERTHEVIEGNESGSFIENWRENFRFYQKGVDAYRWVSMNRGEKYHALIIDGAFLFGMSHLTEMVSGPIAMTVSVSQGWPEWLTAAFAAGGAVISVPGLDPLCIMIFAVYSKSPGFRSGVGKLRMGLMKGVQAGLKVTGAQAFLHKVFSRREIRPWLSTLGHVTTIEETDDRLRLSFDYPTEAEPLRLVVEVKEDTAYLKEVITTQSHRALLKDDTFKQWLKPFGWNAGDFVRAAITNALRAEDGLWKKHYVQEALHGEAATDVVLSDRAVGITAPLASSPSGSAGRCMELFAMP